MTLNEFKARGGTCFTFQDKSLIDQVSSTATKNGEDKAKADFNAKLLVEKEEKHKQSKKDERNIDDVLARFAADIEALKKTNEKQNQKIEK